MRAMTTIQSPANPRIRAATALRERRDRDRTGRTLVDGARECRRAIEAGVRVEIAYRCPPLIRSADALAAVARLEVDRVPIVDVAPAAFERLAFGDRNDGLVLEIRAPRARLEDLPRPAHPLFLVTEDVEKPGNLGAILRSADGAGASAVIAVGGTDLHNPNVVRASVGTVFSVPVAAASVAETLAWLRASGLRVVTARTDAAHLHTDADLTGPLAIVLGSEADGLSDAWRDEALEGVRLPMLGIADSLNVSAAAAVLLYEARRQRDVPGAER